MITKDFNLRNFISFTLTLVLTILIIYRSQIGNNFLFILGDNTYDNTIHTSILEHWFNVVKGFNSWSEVGYFHPFTKTIAQTDAYFLVAFFYIPFRLIGFDPYLSTELAGIFLKIFGFIFAFLFSRNAVNMPFRYSLLVSTLFTINNAMTIHGYRIQLATVAFVPAIGLIVYLTLKHLRLGNSILYMFYGSLGAIFFGLWCFTCLYASYFFFLYMAAFLFLATVFNFKLVKSTISKIFEFKYQSTFIFASLITSLIPFIVTFYPKSKESKPRSIDAIFSSTVPLEEILQVGELNIFNFPIFAKLINFISPNYLPRPNWEYYNTGFTLFIFLLFLISIIYFILNFRNNRTNLFFYIAISSFIFIMLVVNFKGFSLWMFIYEYIPGGKALGVISSALIFVAFPIYISGAHILCQLNLKAPLFTLISLILILSEINLPPLKLDRINEINRNFSVSIPPMKCESFYVSGWLNQEKNQGYWEWFNNQYAHNVTAMLLSQKLHMPTLNGMASFIPISYDLVGPNVTAFSPNSDEYQLRIDNYISRYKLNNVCRLDLNSKSWSLHNYL